MMNVKHQSMMNVKHQSICGTSKYDEREASKYDECEFASMLDVSGCGASIIHFLRPTLDFRLML